MKILIKLILYLYFIILAIYGCGFCTGGRKAFRVLSDNILRVAAINSVGDFVLFLGKVLVVALTVVAGVYLIQVRKNIFINYFFAIKVILLLFLNIYNFRKKKDYIILGCQYYWQVYLRSS